MSGNGVNLVYQIFVRSFCDSNNDGIGDLNGIISKIDYLKEMGVDAIWLTPIFYGASYHKYDTLDYYQIDPEFGSMQDFESLVSKLHEHGIQLYLDLVINHTSSRHPWFQKAIEGDAQYSDYYHWLPIDEIKRRGIERRAATDDSGLEFPWHKVTKEGQIRYFGMFWKEMPDLNYSSDVLKEEIIRIAQFWLAKGVDGFRLDAAKHIFPSWEAKEKTIEFWAWFRGQLALDYPKVQLIGEVWDKPEVVSPYFKSFDTCFNIDFNYNLKNVLAAENGGDDLIQNLIETYHAYAKVNPNFYDALFLSNHDVERIASSLGRNGQKLKLSIAISMTLPAQLYLYYGDELGMKGKKPDQYLRECFVWDEAKKMYWLKPKYNSLKQIKPLTAQRNDAFSIFNWYQKWIQIRKNSGVLNDKSYQTLHQAKTKKDGLMSYKRINESEQLLILHNLTGKEMKVMLHQEEAEFQEIFYSNGFLSGTHPQYAIPPYESLILKRSVTPV